MKNIKRTVNIAKKYFQWQVKVKAVSKNMPILRSTKKQNEL